MKKPKIGVVGPCASGKSSLVSRLHAIGYNARHIAQEHSYVPEMWKKITNPDVLIYLDVSYENTRKRKELTWSFEEFELQLNRLVHARQHANFIVHTDTLTLDDVLLSVIDFLESTNSIHG